MLKRGHTCRERSLRCIRFLNRRLVGLFMHAEAMDRDDQTAVPKCYCRIEGRIADVIWETVLSLLPEEFAKALESLIQETRPDNDAIKAAVAQNELVPGAEVRRGTHLRVV